MLINVLDVYTRKNVLESVACTAKELMYGALHEPVLNQISTPYEKADRVKEQVLQAEGHEGFPLLHTGLAPRAVTATDTTTNTTTHARSVSNVRGRKDQGSSLFSWFSTDLMQRVQRDSHGRKRRRSLHTSRIRCPNR